MACSKGGLSETELQYLLSDDLTESVPMMTWAEVRRTLKPFLRNNGGRGEQERIDFFHASIQEVIRLFNLYISELIVHNTCSRSPRLSRLGTNGKRLLFFNVRLK